MDLKLNIWIYLIKLNKLIAHCQFLSTFVPKDKTVSEKGVIYSYLCRNVVIHRNEEKI